MSRHTEADIAHMLDAVAIEYADEERAAAEDESREAAASKVFSVRLPAETYEAVRVAATEAHLTPSALIRQWVSERVEDRTSEPADGDVGRTIEALRRDLDRLARLTALA